ncbi:cllaC-motif containing domain [Caudoviricetes sp.]|nr:cllaC-motif containing domain [Caudoviricetes sp.]
MKMFLACLLAMTAGLFYLKVNMKPKPIPIEMTRPIQHPLKTIEQIISESEQ